MDELILQQFVRRESASRSSAIDRASMASMILCKEAVSVVVVYRWEQYGRELLTLLPDTRDRIWTN